MPWTGFVKSAEYNMSVTIMEVLKNETPTLGNVLLGAVTYDEITSLDSRIKSCLIENPNEESREYYAKIRFAYKMNNGNPQPDGRQEFATETKEQLLSEIQYFMKSDKVGWCIL
jgi:hypothetical protein